MMLLTLLAVATVHLAHCHADINVPDFIFWKKSDINAWHQFFPMRMLEGERLTSMAAVGAANSLVESLNTSLAGIVTFQAQELKTAQMLMAGTDAEGCVAGISNFIPNTIDDEESKFNDCIADTWSKIDRLNSTWSKVRSRYLTAYQRALTGIDACAKTYPNKDSIDRLKSCVDSMNNNYFVAVNNTKNSLVPSPIMSYFERTVVQCASKSAVTVASKGSQFLKMLVECATLSGTIDPQVYAEELSKWKGYNDTLANQVLDAQTQNQLQVQTVETDIQNYYNLQKQVLEKYVIESRGYSYYLSKIYSLLGSYYNTITTTALDNPGDSICIANASMELDYIASIGATESLTCDLAIVNDTKKLMTDIYDNSLFLNNIMTGIGNAAILQCFSRGFIFAPNTISACYRLVSYNFTLDYEDRHGTIDQEVNTISAYVNSFFNGSNLPCGGTSASRMYLGGETSLYNMQRCLYSHSGTTYFVTTPATPSTANSSEWSVEPNTPTASSQLVVDY